MGKKIRLGLRDQEKLRELALKRRRKKVLLREQEVPRDPRAILRRKKALALYDKQVSYVYQAVLESVLRAVATAQAVSDVNADLESQFGMAGVEIDSQKVRITALEVMQVEIAEALLGKSTVSTRSRRELVNRIVGRLAPLRDGAPAPTPYPTRPTREDRVGDLERLIQREMKRSFPPPKQEPKPRARGSFE